MVGKFRVPSLRNVALTAPYMHDGSVPSLEQAVRHTGTIAPGEARELVTFLETLTETAALK